MLILWPIDFFKKNQYFKTAFYKASLTSYFYSLKNTC